MEMMKQVAGMLRDVVGILAKTLAASSVRSFQSPLARIQNMDVIGQTRQNVTLQAHLEQTRQAIPVVYLVAIVHKTASKLTATLKWVRTAIAK